MAQQRSSVYGFLSLIYRDEPTIELLRQLKGQEFVSALSDLRIELDLDFLKRTEEELLWDLSVEYTRLFLGPGQHISPHESVHRKGEEGLLWGETTAKVKRFIETSGLKYRSAWKGIPDHISVELEFMQRLIQYEADSWQRKDYPRAIRSLQLQRRFIGGHLLQWIPSFSGLVIREARSDFYRQMAELTEEYIIFEAERIDDLIDGGEGK